MEAYNLAVKELFPGYKECKWGDFDMIVNSDGYFNVSKLCGEADKKFNDWKRLRGSIKLI